MALTKTQNKFLRTKALSKRPVVLLGNAGLTPAVLREIELGLGAHELLKIRLPAIERGARAALYTEICEQTGAEAVQLIGRVAVLYRRAQKPRLELPA